MTGNTLAELRAKQRCVDGQAREAKGQASARVDSPVVEAPPAPIPAGNPNDPVALMQMMAQLLKLQTKDQRLVVNILNQLGRTAATEAVNGLLVPTIDSKAFCYPITQNLAIAASASAFTTLLSIKVPEGYCGILTKIGLAADPTGGFADLQWQICNSDEADPYFVPSGYFSASTLSTPLDFFKVFPPQRNIELRARNGSAVGPVVAQAVLLGFFRPLKHTSRI